MSTQKPVPSPHLQPRTYAILPDDDARMVAALLYLFRNRVRFRRTSSSQIKIGAVNFWPRRGKIYRDGDAACLTGRGLEELARELRLPIPGSPQDGAATRTPHIAAEARTARVTDRTEES